LILVLFSLGLNPGSFSNSPPDNQKDKKNNEQSDHYKKWFDIDVRWIISEDEKKVFKALKNDEERENFIEDFWNRRNPNPKSSNNTFKEEHYRRIAYANEHYHSGIPGWRTDRGRIYIMYGAPDENESHPTGGHYYRTEAEGGGDTSTFPFEKWWYRHIDGLGDDIEIEFVDSSNSGEYKIAMSPDEKDALINVEGVGLTLAEQMGLSQKRDRAYFNPSGWYDPGNAENTNARQKDSPFSRMEQYFNLQRPPEIKFNDLRTIVTTHVTFDDLAYNVRIDYIRLSQDRVIAPISIELNNADLEYKKDREVNRATVNVYGVVKNLNNRYAHEWEDTISREFSDQQFEAGKSKRSAYQHIVALSPGVKYKLELVLKDANSKSQGTRSIGLNPPKYEESGLQSSTIILADSIGPVPAATDQLEQYVIGDLKVRPNVMSEFKPEQFLFPYMQVYGMGIDQANEKPSLDVSFRIKQQDKVLKEIEASEDNSEQLFYGPRVVLLGKIPLKDMAPGKYVLEIRVSDKIMNHTLSTTADFKVIDPAQKKLASVP
jgi:GWxTD domain-containing protein